MISKSYLSLFNQIQYDIIKMLSAPKNNLFIVGDDDQSIYRFRGARPEIMLHFEEEYTAAKKVFLDINYRCSGQIVKAAAEVIQYNKNRFQKNIRPYKKQGVPVVIRQFEALSGENSKITEEIIFYHKNGIPFSEIGVLFRTKTQPRALIEKMMEYQIPFRMKDVIPNIYEHWIAKDISAYIKMAMDKPLRPEFLRVMNRPKRYLSREYINSPGVDFDYLSDCYKGKPWIAERVSKLIYDLGVMKKMHPFAAIHYIRRGIGYEDYLTEYAAYRGLKPEELIDILEELMELSRPYKTYEEWFLHIEKYGQELKYRMAEMRNNAEDAVAMDTMHGAKGLEYRIVFIIDANEGITPYKKAVLQEDLEEERRMFYVALTRAKERLHVYYVKERYNKELAVSRFVEEMLGLD